MKKILLIICITAELYGCHAAAKMLAGISDPKVENENSLMAYMNKIGMETGNIVTIDTSVYLAAWIRNQNSIPEAEIFDQQGRNIEYKSTGMDCNAGVFGFVPILKKDTLYTVKDSLSLFTLLDQLRDLRGNKITPVTETYDYYFFIYWAKWTGKLNENHVMKWEKLAIANKALKIKVIKVNLDFQQWWGEGFTDYVIRKMSKKGK